jgi:hypothetical protein
VAWRPGCGSWSPEPCLSAGEGSSNPHTVRVPRARGPPILSAGCPDSSTQAESQHRCRCVGWLVPIHSSVTWKCGILDLHKTLHRPLSSCGWWACNPFLPKRTALRILDEVVTCCWLLPAFGSFYNSELSRPCSRSPRSISIHIYRASDLDSSIRTWHHRNKSSLKKRACNNSDRRFPVPMRNRIESCLFFSLYPVMTSSETRLFPETPAATCTRINTHRSTKDW